jgi:hypothetical protein
MRHIFNALRLTTALVSVSIFGMAFPSVALSANWVGGTGFWLIPSGWNPAVVPDSSTTVTVSNDTVTVPNSSTAYSSNATIDLGGGRCLWQGCSLGK